MQEKNRKPKEVPTEESPCRTGEKPCAEASERPSSTQPTDAYSSLPPQEGQCVGPEAASGESDGFTALDALLREAAPEVPRGLHDRVMRTIRRDRRRRGVLRVMKSGFPAAVIVLVLLLAVYPRLAVSTPPIDEDGKTEAWENQMPDAPSDQIDAAEEDKIALEAFFDSRGFLLGSRLPSGSGDSGVPSGSATAPFEETPAPDAAAPLPDKNDPPAGDSLPAEDSVRIGDIREFLVADRLPPHLGEPCVVYFHQGFYLCLFDAEDVVLPNGTARNEEGIYSLVIIMP